MAKTRTRKAITNGIYQIKLQKNQKVNKKLDKLFKKWEN